ncbi:MAG: hypothetical protein R6V47_01185, partial [Candidatus Delongbacteria bacterium]
VKDIFILDIESGTITKETESNNYRQFSPFWIDDVRLGYISDETGISNIYYKDLQKNISYSLTNLMTGCTQASYSDNKIAFTSVFKAGYDIFMIEDVEELIKDPEHPENHRWYKEKDFSRTDLTKDTESDFTKTDLSKFKFTKDVLDQTAKEILSDEQKEILRTPKPYKVSFTPDIITVNAGYFSGYGVTGSTYLQFSDYLSNHSFIIVSDLNQDLLNSNIVFFYNYLERRVNLGMGISHDVVYYYTTTEIDGDTYIDDEFRDRLLGFHFSARYPFSRYTRIDSRFNISNLTKDEYNGIEDKYHHIKTDNLFSVSAGYSYDNVIWGYFGPENGTRMRISASHTSELEKPFAHESDSNEFTTFAFDYRKYFRLEGDYQLAFRLTGAFSEGNTPQTFYVGGLSNWFNYRYNSEHEFDTVIDKYYSRSDYPLRGYELMELSGNRYALSNIEFRYPLIKYIFLGFPFPMAFGNIKGVLFSDIGSAWNNSDFRGTEKTADGSRKLNDLLFSSGIGSRMMLGYFILRYDVSWTWDFYSSTSKPLHLFSLGANF